MPKGVECTVPTLQGATNYLGTGTLKRLLRAYYLDTWGAKGVVAGISNDRCTAILE